MDLNQLLVESEARCRTMNVAVVGVTFGSRQKTIRQLYKGEQVQLQREPDNPYDRNAIRVQRINGDQIGYIARGLATSLSPRWDELGITTVPARVSCLKGGTPEQPTMGLLVQFYVP